MTGSEQALLLCVVLAPKRIGELEVEATDFSTRAGGRVWLAILQQIARGDPVDGVTLQEALRGDTEALSALGSALSGSAAPENAGHYAAQVVRDARRRELAALASAAAEAVQTGDPDAIAGQLVTDLVAMGQSGRRSEWTASQLMAATAEAVDRAQTEGRLGIRTGFGQIDRKLGGWHPGELTVVGARPSMGKSAFGLSAAVAAAQHGARVGFVSVEMDPLSIGVRLGAAAAGLSISRVRNGEIGAEESRRLSDGMAVVSKLNLRLLDAPGWPLSRIVRQAHAWHRAGELDLLVVDYLQRIRADRKFDRHDLEVGAAAQEHKTLAGVLGIPVILLAQLNRDLESRTNKRPVMGDLRGSGEIEQEADAILMLYRDAVYNEHADPGAAEILVEKQRQGPTGIIRMRWDGETARWWDPDMRDYEAVA